MKWKIWPGIFVGSADEDGEEIVFLPFPPPSPMNRSPAPVTDWRCASPKEDSTPK